MASKKQILNRLKILITQKFDNPEQAFHFFDKNGDGFLSASELKHLISEAEINNFLSGIVAGRLIKKLDADKDKKFNWREFRKAVKGLLEEA
ncbi:MAG: EF-hand domain-containing protein [Saprospiraceae bacterium]|nr:EF-hand domain-containing protein [Saprospiraceae bacterium]